MPMDPPCQWTPHANDPPPSRKKKHGPPSYPLSKEETSPPRDFFTKSHTNCPFLPSFLSVQLHVMGTILGVMCLVFIHSVIHLIHSVIQPIAVAWDSCLFESIIIAHFTELNFFKQAWGHHFQLCCVLGFHNASLISATSGPSGMLRSNAGHAHSYPPAPCVYTQNTQNFCREVIFVLKQQEKILT